MIADIEDDVALRRPRLRTIPPLQVSLIRHSLETRGPPSLIRKGGEHDKLLRFEFVEAGQGLNQTYNVRDEGTTEIQAEMVCRRLDLSPQRGRQMRGTRAGRSTGCDRTPSVMVPLPPPSGARGRRCSGRDSWG